MTDLATVTGFSLCGSRGAVQMTALPHQDADDCGSALAYRNERWDREHLFAREMTTPIGINPKTLVEEIDERASIALYRLGTLPVQARPSSCTLYRLGAMGDPYRGMVRVDPDGATWTDAPDVQEALALVKAEYGWDMARQEADMPQAPAAGRAMERDPWDGAALNGPPYYGD